MSIHGENNTLFDYWGKQMTGKRKVLPSVKWLVDWSHRNKCGAAVGMPTKWREDDDPVHRTQLEGGYLFEGAIEKGRIVKASYHCWPKMGDDGAFKSFEDQLDEAVKKEEAEKRDATTAADSGKQTEEPGSKEPEKIDDLLGSKDESKDASKAEDKTKEPEKKEPEETYDESLHMDESEIIEHYLLRGYDHGWPRIVMDQLMSNEVASKTKWIPVADDTHPTALRSAGSKSKEAENGFQFGYRNPNPRHRPPAFDATERVLTWFKKNKLPDETSKPPPEWDGFFSDLSSQIEKLVSDIKDKVDQHEKSNQEEFAQVGQEDFPGEEEKEQPPAEPKQNDEVGQEGFPGEENDQPPAKPKHKDEL
jgi:hypothetical protein